MNNSTLNASNNIMSKSPSLLEPIPEQSDVLLSEEDLLKKALADKSMFMDNTKFFDLLQEKPIPVENSRSKRNHFRPKGSGNQYKGIYYAAKLIVDIYATKTSIFAIPKTNRSQTINKMCQLIFTSSRAGLEKRKDIYEHMHPTIWEYVKDETNGEKEFFICRQRDLLACAIKFWGKTCESNKITIPSDYCRVIGCFLLDDVKDDLNILQGGRKNVDDADDPRKRKEAIFNRVATLFNSTNVSIVSPQAWEKCTHLHGWDQIDPNDTKRISIERTGTVIRYVYEKISTEYKKAMTNYTKGTGGGSGKPEDFMVWEERDATKFFKDYAGNTTYLTWVHLADKESNFLLYAKYEGLPSECKMDGAKSYVSSTRESPRRTKRDNELFSNMVSTSKSMQNTIEKSTKALIEAVVKSSDIKGERTKSSVMDDMNKAGQLYDKAVHALKTKKRKLLSTGTNPQEVKQKVNEEMKSIKIHKGNLRALEHELETMNEEMVSDIDISDLEDTLSL